ncbi:hypothetical protein A5881_003624 [Enterococcus termitis]
MINTYLDTIGKTPVIKLKDRNIFAKLELNNPYGMKDRFAKYVIEKGIREKIIDKNSVIIESSSGTLALGLALVGNYYELETHIVTDPRIDKLTLAKLSSLGTKVHIVEKMNDAGWQGARLGTLYKLKERYGSRAFWPQQYTNIDNQRSYSSIREDISNLGKEIDYFVCAVGSGGSISGTATAIKEEFPNCRIIAVDCVGSTLFGRKDNPKRLQSGLGNSLIPANIDYNLIDEVHWLNDNEAFSATLDLANNEQIFAGNSSGSVYWVSKYISTKFESSNVFTIFPDRGDRYLESIYSTSYWDSMKIERVDYDSCKPLKMKQISNCTDSWNYFDWNRKDR